MKKINKYDDFVKEEFNISLGSFKSLLDKVKGMLSKTQISEFIDKNKEEIKSVQTLLEDEDGQIDYQKAFEFVKQNVKKK